MERGNLAKNYILANFTKMFFLDLKALKTKATKNQSNIGNDRN
jgi:hypothetical protein